MIRENTADSRHGLSGQRGAIDCRTDGPKGGAVAGESRSARAMVQRDAIGTWEGEGGSVIRDHWAAVERPERYGLTPGCRRRCDRLETAVSELGRELEFKEAVLQEMHHRVKNTLQIAASSLSLQFHATRCTEAQAALRQAFDRLHVLAVVHEMLSLQATHGRTIAMPPLLRALASGLEKSFSELSARVGLRVSAEEVSLGVDQAIALALFANEAVTNAYIHAFPDGACGEIVVDLRYTSEAVILEVSDTGTGMSSSGRKDGLGMNLIRGFARQLAATLSCTSGEHTGGTVLNLWLPLDARRSQEISAMSGQATHRSAS